MNGACFTQQEIDSLMGAVNRAIEEIDERTILFQTESGLDLLRKERARYEQLYAKLKNFVSVIDSPM